MSEAYSFLHGLAVDLVGVAAWVVVACATVWVAAGATSALSWRLRRADAILRERKEWRELHALAARLRAWDDANAREQFIAAWMNGDPISARSALAELEHERRQTNGLPPVTAADVNIPDGMPDEGRAA